MNKAINKELQKRGLSPKSNKIRHKKFSYSDRFIDGRNCQVRSIDRPV